ncbi:MAG TPA: hypothetical protein VGA32_05340 [Anaerolineales bacterium]
MRKRTLCIVLGIVLSSCGPAQVTAPEAQNQAPEAGPGVAADALLIGWKADGGGLLPLELDGEQPTYGEVAIPIGMFAVRALSPDGHTLASLNYPDNDSPQNANLLWIDLASWQARTSAVGFNAWVSGLSFSPDGSRLAVASAVPTLGGAPPTEFNLQLIDVEADVIIAEAALEVQPAQIAFSADGELLSVYGSAPYVNTKTPSGPPTVSVFDGRDLMLLGWVTLEGVLDGVMPLEDDNLREPFLSWSPAIVFAPDGRTLYLVHADEDRLTRVDLVQRRVTTVEIAPPRSWFERILTFGVETAYAKGAGGGFLQGLVSPDGTRLYILGGRAEPMWDDQGNLSFSTTDLGLRVIDAATGTEIARVDTHANEISFGMGGDQIFLHGWGPTSFGWTDVVNAATLENVKRFNYVRLFSAQDSAGRWHYITVRGSNSSKLTVVDVATGAELVTWQFATANGVEVMPIP